VKAVIGIVVILSLLVFSFTQPVRLNHDSILADTSVRWCRSCVLVNDSCGFLEGVSNGIAVPGVAVRMAFSVGKVLGVILIPLFVAMYGFIALFQGDGAYLLGYLPFALVMAILVTPFLPPSRKVYVVIFFK